MSRHRSVPVICGGRHDAASRGRRVLGRLRRGRDRQRQYVGDNHHEHSGSPRRVSDAVLGGDIDAVMDAVTWEIRECAATPLDPHPSPPRCLGEEMDRTLVPSILWISGLERWIRPENFRASLKRVFAEQRPLCRLVRLAHRHPPTSVAADGGRARSDDRCGRHPGLLGTNRRQCDRASE